MMHRILPIQYCHLLLSFAIILSQPGSVGPRKLAAIIYLTGQTGVVTMNDATRCSLQR